MAGQGPTHDRETGSDRNTNTLYTLGSHSGKQGLTETQIQAHEYLLTTGLHSVIYKVFFKVFTRGHKQIVPIAQFTQLQAHEYLLTTLSFTYVVLHILKADLQSTSKI